MVKGGTVSVCGWSKGRRWVYVDGQREDRGVYLDGQRGGGGWM